MKKIKQEDCRNKKECDLTKNDCTSNCEAFYAAVSSLAKESKSK